ncbi:MAG: Eco47II family restriction endonuclease [Alphaproteobacteria bacterium]|nr:Eco47II family restriction endonuclease [Alphaproteobacteria bacterium]
MLSWISDKDLREICESIILHTKAKTKDEVDFKNIVDPFSAVFDIAINDMSFDDWFKNENIRQKQKTLQNQIGRFHQSVLGKIKGWEDLGVGGVVDLVNREKGIIAEVKNKYNTVKGSDKIGVHDKLSRALNYGHRGSTAYFVSILAKGRINSPFTPSDNEKGVRPAVNEKIREVDGATFYEIATDSSTALADLYAYLPKVLADITGTKADKISKDPWFIELFTKAIK